jgi:hypothetical protein
MSRFSTADIPGKPGVYAFHEGERVLWVGFGEDIRERVEHHLLQGEPMTSPGISRSEGVDPRKVTKVVWWLYPGPAGSDVLEAAWALAVRALSPEPRPRYDISKAAAEHLEDEGFIHRVRTAVEGRPDGVFIPQTLDALTRTVAELEGKVEALEARLNKGSDRG